MELLNYEFQNLTEKGMSFESVYAHIKEFMKQDAKANYHLIVGTDSQVHAKETRFISGIVIQRENKGAWACVRKVVVPRRMEVLHERISYETSLTEDIFMMLDEERRRKLENIVLEHVYKGAGLSVEGHIDIGSGKRNKTRVYVNEMVSRMESMGVSAKIKPEAFVASSYANRYTK